MEVKVVMIIVKAVSSCMYNMEVVTILYWWLHNEYIVMLMILDFRDVFISMQSRKPTIQSLPSVSSVVYNQLQLQISPICHKLGAWEG